MRNQTIGRRIAAGYGVVLVLMLGTAVFAILSLRSSRENFTSAVATLQDRALGGTESLQGLDASSVAMTSYLLTGRAATIDTLEERFKVARAAAVGVRESSTTPAQVSGWSEVVRQLDQWHTAVQNAVDLKRSGDDAGALKAYNENVIPVRSSMRNLAVDLVAAERKRSGTTATEAADDALRSIWLLVAVAAAAMILGVLIAWGLGRAVTRHLHDAVATIASASTGILAATAQQASGAAEEETAIHQTTATADEVRQTVALTTEKARLVAKDVRETAEISRDGRRAVDESVRGTQEARARMEALAERILTLSDQAQAIGEIVRTVNGLAEQSNLLSVNAGIEAAKAGDAGRGFAVVASEVKSLAEQSRQATSQIRDILSEIQGATQAAVMAAEQGVKASEAGEAITTEAGEAIRQLGDRLAQAADSAQQILASSQQQMTGVDQVALAMQNIREASSQNMAATRQVEQAARELDNLSKRLTDLVSPNGRRDRTLAGAYAEA
ncbi:methyl-accepting chemotaxis protein [Solirubrobacter ginsenosidimutans]|uniref:Methyl-accepting chemotaxis protein n=1 Tax=Solirubrobacter ginsenosidimutans TaxID=490573 RepID=A0A9X3S661_9ACTN|nr:methyl-accepting chemotaxis protein [Solirubrobacter ginsenosidimutans]MDA0164821.1 methyl-accepting chemotaxis protein [Solirubrobacter ginsenosidimutans]